MNPVLVFVGCIIALVFAGKLGIDARRRWKAKKAATSRPRMTALAEKQRLEAEEAMKDDETWESWCSEKSGGSP